MVKHGVIPEFRGEYYFLSNYYYSPFIWRGICFNWSEQAFAFAKTYYAIDKVKGESQAVEILTAKTPGDAKRLGGPKGGMVINVDEWNKIKVQYMREIVHAKFMTSEESLVGPLVNTGAKMLVEGNDWNDTFWGRCNGKGFNTLGVILMEERGWWSRSDEGRP